MKTRESDQRTFNVGRALKHWQKRYPWKLERITMLERIRDDANARGHHWTAANVEKMLRELGA